MEQLSEHYELLIIGYALIGAIAVFLFGAMSAVGSKDLPESPDDFMED